MICSSSTIDIIELRPFSSEVVILSIHRCTVNYSKFTMSTPNCRISNTDFCILLCLFCGAKRNITARFAVVISVATVLHNIKILQYDLASPTTSVIQYIIIYYLPSFSCTSSVISICDFINKTYPIFYFYCFFEKIMGSQNRFVYDMVRKHIKSDIRRYN